MPKLPKAVQWIHVAADENLIFDGGVATVSIRSRTSVDWHVALGPGPRVVRRLGGRAAVGLVVCGHARSVAAAKRAVARCVERLKEAGR